MKRLLAFSFALAALVACAGGSSVSGDRRVVGGVTVTFTVTPAQTEVGRAVRFVLRLTNNAGRAEKLTFNSGQQFDFWVTDADKEIWRWSEERLFTQAIDERTLDAQGSLTLAESWTTTKAGSFVAHGEVKAQGYERALTGELTVRD
jgi:hypothetical protein